MSWMARIGIVLGLATTGCSPSLYAVSTPPPTRDAEHSSIPFQDDVLRLSRGVAIAFDCYDPFLGGSCREATAKIDDPEIAKVFPAHLERAKDPYYGGYGDARRRSGFVMVGVKEGRTTVHVQSAEGVRNVVVIVE